MMVGQVEKIKTEHMKVDMICDQKQKEIVDGEKKLHDKIEKDKKELQDDCTRQFKDWAQQQQRNSPHQQTPQSVINSNKTSDIVIKCDNNGNLKW